MKQLEVFVKFNKMAAFILAALLCAAWVPFVAYAVPQRLAADCVNPTWMQSPTNLFPSRFQILGPIDTNTATVTVAKLFQVAYFDTYKVATNLVANETYVLYQCGTPKPDASAFPAGVKFFSIPLSSVSSPDSTSGAFLSTLGLLGRVSHASTYSANPCLQYLSSTCKLVSAGAKSPDLSSQGDDVASFNYQRDAKLPRSIAFTSTSDPGALNRAEWLKFMSLFFNAEQRANSIFTAISSNYQSVSSVAKTVAAARSSPLKVAWIQWWPASPDYGPFGANIEAIAINFPKYKEQLTADAGASIMDLSTLQPLLDSRKVFQPAYWGTDSVYMYKNETDLLRQLLKDVDVVIDEARYATDDGGGVADPQINVTAFLKAYGLAQSDVSTLKFLSSAVGLLREDGQSGPKSYNEWFERAVVRPDQVLTDLVQALYPDALTQLQLLTTLQQQQQSAQLQLSSPFFLRNVGKGQAPVVQVASMCSTQSGCALPASPICPYIYMACNGSIAYATAEQPCGPAICPSDSSDGSSSSNQALIIGLCVGLIVPACLLLIASVAYAMMKSKQAKQLPPKIVEDVPATITAVAGGKPIAGGEPVVVNIGP